MGANRAQPCLERENDVQIQLNFSLTYIGYVTGISYGKEVPTKAVEMGGKKILGCIWKSCLRRFIFWLFKKNSEIFNVVNKGNIVTLEYIVSFPFIYLNAENTKLKSYEKKNIYDFKK